MTYSANRERHWLPYIRRSKQFFEGTIHIYYIINQILKHEKIWWLNVLLKQKVMFISREIIVKRDKRRTDGNVDRIKLASVCRQRGTDVLYRNSLLLTCGDVSCFPWELHVVRCCTEHKKMAHIITVGSIVQSGRIHSLIKWFQISCVWCELLNVCDCHLLTNGH